MQFISSIALVATSFLSSAWIYASDAPEMMDRYETECLQEEQGVSTVRSLDLGSEAFVLGQQLFLDATCASLAYRFDYSGTYTRDAEAETIDWLLAKVAITPANAMIAGAFNQNQLCGLSNWQANVAIDVTGLECQGNVLLEAPTYFYDRMRETEEGIKLGLPSDEADGSSPNARPVDFEDVVYKPVQMD